MSKHLWLALLFWGGFCLPALAAIDSYSFANPAEEQLFRQLVAELRCPKCQNNNLHDSDAELAQDLRDLVYAKVREGESREQIIAYLVERYGPFIHYQPPAPAAVMIILPAVLFLLLGCGWLWWWVKRPQADNEQADNSQQQSEERP